VEATNGGLALSADGDRGPTAGVGEILVDLPVSLLKKFENPPELELPARLGDGRFCEGSGVVVCSGDRRLISSVQAQE
jgi:hypothetical protein